MIHFEFISWKISKGANYHKTQPLLVDLWSRVSVSTTYSTNTIWRVIFGGANFPQKSKVAVRINFRDWMEAQWRCAHMCTHGTKYASQCVYGVHAPLAMCVLLTIDWASCHSYTICWAIAQAMGRFSIDSCVRGYNVYNDIWEASVGEEHALIKKIYWSVTCVYMHSPSQ